METYVNMLIDVFEKKLKTGNDADIKLELKKSFSELENIFPNSQEDYAVRVSEVLFKYGLDAINNHDYYKLLDSLDWASDVFYKYPEFERVALVFIMLTGGMLEVKLETDDLDELDAYQKILKSILEYCTLTEKIALQCMISYANLQTCCAMTAKSKSVFPVELSFIKQNIDQMELLSSKFPNHEELNLIYCRSLAAFAYDLSGHSNKEMYRDILQILKNLVKTRKFDVPEAVMDFLSEA